MKKKAIFVMEINDFFENATRQDMLREFREEEGFFNAMRSSNTASIKFVDLLDNYSYLAEELDKLSVAQKI